MCQRARLAFHVLRGLLRRILEVAALSILINADVARNDARLMQWCKLSKADIETI
jgi:hypothetical protein